MHHLFWRANDSPSLVRPPVPYKSYGDIILLMVSVALTVSVLFSVQENGRSLMG
jgi:hypothetical protein